MIEIAGGIVLAVIVLALLPNLILATLWVLPPVIGALIGAFAGLTVAPAQPAIMLTGAIGGLLLGIFASETLRRRV